MPKADALHLGSGPSFAPESCQTSSFNADESVAVDPEPCLLCDHVIGIFNPHFLFQVVNRFLFRGPDTVQPSRLDDQYLLDIHQTRQQEICTKMQKTASRTIYAFLALIAIFAVSPVFAQPTPEQAATDAALQATLKLRTAADTLTKAADAITVANIAAASTPPANVPVAGGTTVVQAPAANPVWANVVSSIVESALAIVSMVLTGLIAAYVPRALQAFETKTGVQLTAQQQATVMQAAITAKGILETQLDNGIIHVGQIAVSNPAVIEQANAAIARVPDAAAALSKSSTSMAETIVGLVDTQSRKGNLATAPQVVAPLPPVVTQPSLNPAGVT